MSARYLLPCSCGKSIAVAASQAGSPVTCECGATLEAPRLRDLKALPVEADGVPDGSGWSFRLGVLSAGFLLAGALAGGAAWFAATEPEAPAPFNEELRNEAVDRGLDDLPPVDLWRMLVSVYQPAAKTGFVRAESPQDQYIQSVIAQSRWYRDGLLIAAGVVFLTTVVLFAVSPK